MNFVAWASEHHVGELQFQELTYPGEFFSGVATQILVSQAEKLTLRNSGCQLADLNDTFYPIACCDFDVSTPLHLGMHCTAVVSNQLQTKHSVRGKIVKRAKTIRTFG